MTTSRITPRRDAAPTLADADITDLLRRAERADRALLAMVSCLALATLVLAAASSLASLL